MRDPLFLAGRPISGRSPEFGRKILAFTRAIAGLGILAAPAYAHYASGGQTPANALEGCLSSLGHPVAILGIGITLLSAFVVG